MLGAIAGDIIGSVYENNPVKNKDFDLFSNDCCFTDDTVLSLAVARVILNKQDYHSTFREFYRKYPDQGYGYGFRQWVISNDDQPYYSYGNGSAMRVNPVGWAFQSLTGVLIEAKKVQKLPITIAKESRVHRQSPQQSIWQGPEIPKKT